MISLFYGENDFALKKHLAEIVITFGDGIATEKIDGNDISINDLPDLLSGATLFSSKRLIVVYDASDNKELWVKLADYAQKIGEAVSKDTRLILVETAPDKRTRTFKLLQKNAEVKEFKNLNQVEVVKWLLDEANNLDIQLDRNWAEKIVDRVGTDQWKLHFALQKLAHVDEINATVINQQIETTPQTTVFELIDASLNRQPDRVYRLVQDISSREDPYFFFGLLSSQLFQLVTLAASDKSPSKVAVDLGVHPYPLQKLNNFAKQLKRADMQEIANIIAQCDDKLKRSGAEPWLLIEQALIKLASR